MRLRWVRSAVNMPPFNVTRRRYSVPATVLAISFLRQQDRFHRARMLWIGDGVRRGTVGRGVAGQISTIADRHPVGWIQPEVQSMRALPVIERRRSPVFGSKLLAVGSTSTKLDSLFQ